MSFMENLANGKYNVSQNVYKLQDDDMESNASQDVEDTVEAAEDILKDFEVHFYEDYVKPLEKKVEKLEKKVEKLSKRENENKSSGSNKNSGSGSNSSNGTKVDIYSSGLYMSTNKYNGWVYFINQDQAKQLWKAKPDGSNAQCLVAKATNFIDYIEDGYVYYYLRNEGGEHRIKV